MREIDYNPGELPEGFTLVKFFRPNCGPCKELDRSLTNKDFLKEINFLSINPQNNLEWVLDYNIRSVPTTIGFLDNKEVFRVVGNKAKEIEEKISNL
jgi:thiol-disulfide isomerase/thioredoxin